jgi:hypothetical protein
MTTDVAPDRPVSQPVPAGALASQLFAAAWMAVALGFALEGLTALGAFTLGRSTSLQVFFASVGQKVGWGTIVCVGLAFAKAFKPKDAGAAAWAGMLAAPLAFTLARAIHKGLAQALGLDVASTAPALLVLLTSIKALQYGVLGSSLARLDELETATLSSYLRTGAWVAILFGGATLAATALFSPVSASAGAWLARGINELLFPMGCALVLFVASVAGRRLGAQS